MTVTKEYVDSLTAANDTQTPPKNYGGISINAVNGLNYPNTISGGPYTVSSNVGIASPWAGSASVATSGKMTLLGDDADLVINGKSLTKTLEAIEERLNIMTPNTKLEAEWEELRELGNQYRELEATIKAKMATYEALKRYDPT